MSSDSEQAWLAFFAVHLVVPLLGVAVYLRIVRNLRVTGTDAGPHWPLFILFFTYGGLLLLALTALFGAWSGAASIGLGYLILIAPVLMLCIGRLAWRRRHNSSYHQRLFWAAACYVPILVGLYVLFSAANILLHISSGHVPVREVASNL